MFSLSPVSSITEYCSNPLLRDCKGQVFLCRNPQSVGGDGIVTDPDTTRIRNDCALHLRTTLAFSHGICLAWRTHQCTILITVGGLYGAGWLLQSSKKIWLTGQAEKVNKKRAKKKLSKRRNTTTKIKILFTYCGDTSGKILWAIWSALWGTEVSVNSHDLNDLFVRSTGRHFVMHGECAWSN